MKGIILAAGKGTRLYPSTKPVCKPLVPVYDKPLIYYPMAMLMAAGIREVLIIVPPDEQTPFERLFGDGSALGMSISYRVQPVQRGIADAFLIGEEFIGEDSVCLALGDNIFCGGSLDESLVAARAFTDGAAVFGYWVEDPRPFGVVEFDENHRAVSIEEKPASPKSNYIVPGLYFYDNRVVSIAKEVKPSARGELEITSVNNAYLEAGQLHVVPLGQDVTWFDAGTADSLLLSANTIQKLQRESGRQIACLEEIAWRKGFITTAQLAAAGEGMKSTPYGQYLLALAK